MGAQPKANGTACAYRLAKYASTTCPSMLVSDSSARVMAALLSSWKRALGRSEVGTSPSSCSGGGGDQQKDQGGLRACNNKGASARYECHHSKPMYTQHPHTQQHTDDPHTDDLNYWSLQTSSHHPWLAFKHHPHPLHHPHTSKTHAKCHAMASPSLSGSVASTTLQFMLRPCSMVARTSCSVFFKLRTRVQRKATEGLGSVATLTALSLVGRSRTCPNVASTCWQHRVTS